MYVRVLFGVSMGERACDSFQKFVNVSTVVIVVGGSTESNRLTWRQVDVLSANVAHKSYLPL